MEIEKIKQLIDYYEEKIITKFDDNFNELVLMDFYEGGFEDRIEDEFFYEEYFSRYEQGIIELLLFIEDNFEEEYKNFKLRLIKMKRIIDNHLSKIPKPFNEESLRIRRKSRFLLSSKIEKEKFINILYMKLKENQLINIDENEFAKHFTTNWDNKILWLGTELQLSNLIYLLIKDGYLDSETETFRHKLTSTHFLNKKGNEFKEKQLGAVFSEKKETIAKDDVIIKIMYEMSNEL